VPATLTITCEVGDARELVDQALERPVVKLGVEARQDQGDRPGARVGTQVALESIEVGPPEAMQGADHPGLVEVRHGRGR
jgi:hypothetical protein